MVPTTARQQSSNERDGGTRTSASDGMNGLRETPEGIDFTTAEEKPSVIVVVAADRCAPRFRAFALATPAMWPMTDRTCAT